MQLFPSIDVLGGQVVRLLRGNYDAETVYGDDPVAVARGFADAGAQWIHVVDLDAAREGGNANLATDRSDLRQRERTRAERRRCALDRRRERAVRGRASIGS